MCVEFTFAKNLCKSSTSEPTTRGKCSFFIAFNNASRIEFLIAFIRRSFSSMYLKVSFKILMSRHATEFRSA